MVQRKHAKQSPPPPNRRSARLRSTPQRQHLAAHFPAGELVSVLSEDDVDDDDDNMNTPSSMPSARSTATVIASLAKDNGSALKKPASNAPSSRGAASAKGKKRATAATLRIMTQRRLASSPSDSDSEFQGNSMQNPSSSTTDTDTDDDLEPPLPPPPSSSKKGKQPLKHASSTPTPKRRGRPPGQKNTKTTPQVNTSSTKKATKPTAPPSEDAAATDEELAAPKTNPVVKAPRRRGVRWEPSEVEYITKMVKTHGGRWTWIAAEGVASGALFHTRNGHDVQDKWRILRRKGEEIPDEAAQVAAAHRRPTTPWGAEDTAFLIKMRHKYGNRFVLMLDEGHKLGYFVDRDARHLKEKVRNLEKQTRAKTVQENDGPAVDVAAAETATARQGGDGGVDVPEGAEDETEMPAVDGCEDESKEETAPPSSESQEIHNPQTEDVVIDDRQDIVGETASQMHDEETRPSKRQKISESSDSSSPHDGTMTHMLDSDGFGPQTQAADDSLPPMFDQEPETQARDDDEEASLHTPVMTHPSSSRDVAPSTQWMKQSKNHRRLSTGASTTSSLHASEDVPPSDEAVAAALAELERSTLVFTLHVVITSRKAQAGPLQVAMKYGQTFYDLQRHVLTTMAPDRPLDTAIVYAFDFSPPQGHHKLGDWIKDQDHIYATIH
ncbi:hypothetical protein DYB34_005866 [Aphanomyces astaci]|uniref:Uncharacterized protein n=1 Tax=Aphanomyces astaci TaxID=112090 RepID=A0A3R6WXW1_APHAT|nr:hypothetical protein DYB34_005866 [Aphanomyces astaci]